MRNLFKLKNQESQKGAAAVEFALILPILVLLLAGIVEFSILLYNQQIITNASREGARAAIDPGRPDNPKKDFAEIRAIVLENSDRLIFGEPPNVKFEINGVEGDLNNNVNLFLNRNFHEDDENLDPDEIKIIVEYTYNYLIPQIINLGVTKDLKAETSMRMM